MGIPSYQELMLPLLKVANTNPGISFQEAIERLSDQFELSQDDRVLVLPSGSQRVIANRIGWAKTYLKKAGLLDSPRRGIIDLTEEGRRILASKPEMIDRKYLEQFEPFRTFQKRRSGNNVDGIQKAENSDPLFGKTPEEEMSRIYQVHKCTLVTELLDQIQRCSFGLFERLVLDLMLKLGYGGGHRDAGKLLGKTSDEGVDGVIKEDRLGLKMIYLQAKRWNKSNTIGRPEVQKFAGAIIGKKAMQGIFITTSSFSEEARRYVEATSSPKILLIDGDELCELMWEADLGLDDIGGYRLKRVNLDYFLEG